MQIFLLIMVLAFLVALVIGPFVISFMARMKARQTILHYVEAHKSKDGTPTMGGIIFIVAIVLISCLFFSKDNKLAVVTLAVMCSFGLLGFLDDYIKIKHHQNLGLRPYQKALGQLGISIIITIFAYNSNLIGSQVIIPFFDMELNFSIWYMPFTIFVLLAITNSVNLTDGLDGLAGWTSFIYLAIFSILLLSIYNQSMEIGESAKLINEQRNLLVVVFASLGAILGFLVFNSNPAKIFMGDVGSLSLGGLLASISIFSRFVLLMPLIGIVFVISVVSVILQVLHYKRTKKRIFLMAPYHHHLEKKGIKEQKIVAYYSILTLVVGSTCLVFLL